MLIYNVVLVSSVQKSDSVIHICVYVCVYIYIYIFYFRLFSLINYYKILSIVLCAKQ